MKRWIAGLGVALVAAGVQAGEIGFVEQFALSDDRSVPLQQLIPGTEDFYFYHCLHLQNTGQLDKVPEVLDQWIKRYQFTPRVEEIRNRQALLTYGKNPKGSLERIRNVLGLRFDHQKQQLNPTTDFPRALDQKLISWETLKAQALARYPKTSEGFEDSALETIAGEPLDPDRRRDLLRRLKRPDVPGLAAMVVEDLKYEHSGGFGSHGIHALLLLDQLDECLKLMPELLQDSNFVNAYLSKLQPGPETDWQHDLKARAAYLDALLAFARRLPPVQNSLKAHLLYQRLVLDVSQDVYDKARFLEYLKLPRPVFYVNPAYLRRSEHRDCAANLGADFRPLTACPPVGTDEPLVRRCLMRYLLDAKDASDFADYIESNYLKELLAETKIVNGVGDQEQWYSLLPPARYQALKERVDVELLPVNRETVALKDPVRIQVALKNVPTLIVKTYVLNTLNYYLQKGEEATTAVDLDGLVANDEQVAQYKQVPLRRHVEAFEFPKLDAAGVYVIEFIGNGQSSRALVRKGRLEFTERVGSAGQVFAVYDEDNVRQTKASLWLGGKEYTPDGKGEIVVPFSNEPGERTVILANGGFAALRRFAHLGENYALSAGIHVDREALVEGCTASVMLRPTLAVNGVPADLALLEEAQLALESTDDEGVRTGKVVEGFKLQADAESVYEFRVPDRLRSLRVTLRGKVQNLSRAKKEDLEDSRVFAVNGVDATEKTECLHPRRIEGGTVLELLGKTGEVRPDRPVQVEMKHRSFRDHVFATLQTDPAGRVTLGEMRDIEWVTAKGPEGETATWVPSRDRRALPETLHAIAGEPVLIPYMERPPKDAREAVSLLEMRGSTPVRDCAASSSFRDGFLALDDLPPGDYALFLKATGERVTVRLTEGRREGSHLLSRARYLETRNAAPLQIEAVEVGADALRVRLRNAAQPTRVHVFAARFQPAFDAWEDLGLPPQPGLAADRIEPAVSVYLSGRNIGDEYRYVLDRKYAAKFPGNMLKRPSLLLNPWSLRKTEMGRDEALGGEGWAAAAELRRAAFGDRAAEKQAAGGGGAEAAGGFAKLDFLPEGSLVLANLRPDADGVVAVDRKALGARQHVHVVAVNALNTVYRQVALPRVEQAPRDLRLARPLDPKRNFAEVKAIAALDKGADFVIEDITTSKVEVYDSLASVYRLFSTLSNDPALAEFSFLLGWPDLKPERKRELYSKYACHELSFFLRHKDPEFFRGVIVPYLRNKKNKTFMDHWLLGDDVAGCLKPWEYGRLNVVERVLLGQAVQGQAESTARHVKDIFDLIPPDVERFNSLFQTALRGSALETADRLGLNKAEAEAAAAAAPAAMAAPAEARAAQRAAGGKLDGLVSLGRAEAKSGTEPLAAPGGPPPAPAKPGDALARKRALRDDLNAPMEREKAKEELFAYAEAGDADMKRRASVRQLYRKLDQAEEWVENNYYHRPIEEQIASMVKVNGFWKDYARHTGDGPFLSTCVAEASGSFTEMMAALAVLDLPFAAPEHKPEYQGARMSLRAGGRAVAFHKQIRETAAPGKSQLVLVGQNFFALDDRYRFENNERFDKFVTDEFRARRVYGCQVVLTNPTSSRRKVDALLQIPAGAVPVLNGFATRSLHRQLEPYSTQTIECHFYFPAAGEYAHYPVHVAQEEQTIAAAEPFTFKVVDQLSVVDKTSWPYVSQYGTDDEMLQHLRTNNIDRLDLGLIAFRMRERGVFDKTLDLLRSRHVYQDTLWSYGVYHNAPGPIREYLPHTPFADRCGPCIVSELLTLDPVARYVYQHKEYWPLVNPRVHPLGKTRKILNEAFSAQYQQFLTCLAYRPAMDAQDLLGATVYLLLQDRVEEALKFYGRVPAEASRGNILYDYLTAYLLLSRGKADEARQAAAAYAEYPVDRWRNLFRDVLAQADEAAGAAAKVVDKEDRAQVQTELAASEATLDFKVESRKITVRYQNVKSCVIRYYPMDIELLFSRNPFVQDVGGQFSVVQPGAVADVPLPPGKDSVSVELPKAYQDRNVMIEVSGGGVTRAQAYYPNSLNVQLTEGYGQLRVQHEQTGKPLAQVYVKVYARDAGGRVSFYKDGYTDLRGRFDYSSLNTGEISDVERFAILVLSESAGALVREAAPPKL